MVDSKSWVATVQSYRQTEKSEEEVELPAELRFISYGIKPFLVTTMHMVALALATMMAVQEPSFCTTKVSKDFMYFLL